MIIDIGRNSLYIYSLPARRSVHSPRYCLGANYLWLGTRTGTDGITNIRIFGRRSMAKKIKEKIVHLCFDRGGGMRPSVMLSRYGIILINNNNNINNFILY